MPKRRRRRGNLKKQVIESAGNSAAKREKVSLDPENLIPTGSTLLNCACADNPWAGYGLGKLVNLIGDSSAGKTFLALTCLADVCLLDRFDDYRIIFDDAEEALEFDVSYLFGSSLYDRIDTSMVSDTIQDFQANVLNTIRAEEPFIYVVDSFDALTSDEELEKAFKKALQKAKTETEAKEIKGSYQTEKAKMASEILREIKGRIKETGSTLIVVSQTRDNVGVKFGPKKIRSGGRALKFYSCHEMWMGIRKSLKAMEREIGVLAKMKVSKNKLTGKVREVDIPIYYDYGIDDIAANVDFLVAEKYWKKEKNTIVADGLSIKGVRSKLVEQIEEQGLENKVKELVGVAWNEIEESLRLHRKDKYV